MVVVKLCFWDCCVKLPEPGVLRIRDFHVILKGFRVKV